MAGKEIVTEVWEMIAKWINTPEGEEKYNKAVLGKTINSKHLKIYALMVIAGVLVIILLNRWAIKRNK
jgi:hypothetical protein